MRRVAEVEDESDVRLEEMRSDGFMVEGRMCEQR